MRKIQGIDGENCFEFRGIKYANAKRWEYPQVIEKWQGVFDATCFKECSYQHRGFDDDATVNPFIIMNSETVWRLHTARIANF